MGVQEESDRLPSAPALTQNRRGFLAGMTAAGAALAFPGVVRAQEAKPLRVGIAFADLPRLWGGPEGGFAAMRFAGYPIYDALINWDLESGERPSGLVPGLAESWHLDPANPKRWIVSLRQGVTFHDGSPVDADAVLWN